MKSFGNFFGKAIVFFLFFWFSVVSCAQEGTANIYVMRTSLVGAAIKVPVSINGEQVGKLGSQRYIKVCCPTGEVNIKANMGNKDEIQLQAEEGKDYYVKINIIPGFAVAHVSLEELGFEDGALTLTKCKEQRRK